MKADYRGIFVVSWAQTEIDGLSPPPFEALTIGAVWRWTGASVRVDGPAELLLLHDQEGEAERRRRAARIVRRLVGAAVAGSDPARMPEEEPAPQHGFVVTDGRQSFAISLIDVPGSRARLLMFSGAEPPKDRDCWVISRTVDQPSGHRAAGGVICFTPGTRIATPDGAQPIEMLRPGDRILTKDDGPQEILWTGLRRMSGARLFAMPELRPVRIRAGAMGEDRPEGDLIVSPEHRLVVGGRAARSLFNAEEVLVTARDLVNDRTIRIESALPDVTYIHLMTERHEIVWANGVETESFHPANAALELLDPSQRGTLLALMPEIAQDPMAYGAHARRNLTRPEAAILRHEVA